jgi:hypothetical protein
MKHSYGLTIGFHFRQIDYTRGQSVFQWLASVQRGAIIPWDKDALQRLGGYAEYKYWARITVIGFSVQVNIEHVISNWERIKK